MTTKQTVECDWPNDAGLECSSGFDEPWRSVCAGCGRRLAICDTHYGYHIAYQVLGPACPTCGTTEVATAIPDVPALTFTRVLVHAVQS